MCKTIVLEIFDFPTEPKMLNDKQIRFIYRQSIGMKEKVEQGEDKDKAFHNLLLQLFLYFAKLKVLKKPSIVIEDEMYYFLRRKGLAHLFEEIPIPVSRLVDMIHGNLDWVKCETMEKIASLSEREAVDVLKG